MTISRSPIKWVGGKHYSAKRILQAFPSLQSYKTFVDVFGGAGNILFAKPPHNHLEVYNDYCGDLVNFWMQCRNHPGELQRQIDSLPYARSLYEKWQASLFSGEAMDDMERAVRWFYVLRSAVGGIVRKASGNWGYTVTSVGSSTVPTFRSATELFPVIASRLQYTQIECQDFEHVIKTYGRATTFFYCDPPYIGAEFYYQGIPPFTMADHERLARILNETPAMVALSYYPHEALDEWYPASKWRRLTWTTHKYSEKTSTKRQEATEMLLMNYPAESATLWSDTSLLASEISHWEMPDDGQDECQQVG